MPIRTSLALLCFSLVLAGCGLFSEADSDVINDAKQLLEEQKDANGEPLRVKLPVRLNYSVTRKAMIDQELEIDFEVLTEQAVPVLRIGVQTTEGLELVDDDFAGKYSDLKIREVIHRQAIVKPASENKFYVDVYIITELGEDKKAKLTRIPIGVGDYSLTDNPEPRPATAP